MPIKTELHSSKVGDTLSKTIAITGAAGALGQSLVVYLKSIGCAVRILVTPNDTVTQLKDLVDHLVIGSVEDERCCDELLQNADAVINCAALLPSSLHLGEQKFLSVNVDGAMNILRAAERQGVIRAVFLSTIGVIDHTLKRTVHDLFDYRTQFLDSYSLSKIELEKRLLTQVPKTSVQILIVRPAFIYGPRSVGLWKPVLDQIKSGAFKILGNGEALFPVVFEDDLAQFISQMLFEEEAFGKNSVVITAGPHQLSTKLLFDMIAEVLRCRQPSKVPVRLAYFCASIADRMPKWMRFGPLALLTRRRVKEYSVGYDLSHILNESSFGFDGRTPLRQGIERMVKAYNEEGFSA
jgi:2-alkyl-3-oxoalkanoate reductase